MAASAWRKANGEILPGRRRASRGQPNIFTTKHTEIARHDVLDRLARHTLIHPIRHGARVPLPRTDIEQQMLFDA